MTLVVPSKTLRHTTGWHENPTLALSPRRGHAAAGQMGRCQLTLKSCRSDDRSEVDLPSMVRNTFLIILVLILIGSDW